MIIFEYVDYCAKGGEALASPFCGIFSSRYYPVGFTIRINLILTFLYA